MHTFPSSQDFSLPDLHTPPLHASPTVQPLSSLHAAVSSVWLPQPVAESQLSLVHGLPSSQDVLAPGTHTPPWHASPLVHASPSEHANVFGLLAQPAVALQRSSVQGFWSSQVSAAPGKHKPPLHVSLSVHALPSVHGAALKTWSQPLSGVHGSSVQGLPSSQTTAAPGWQLPPPQASFCVQTSPSEQGAVLFAWLHSPVLEQLSVVQGFWSSHTVASPGRHLPLRQLPSPVHGSPSSQVSASSKSLSAHVPPGAHQATLQACVVNGQSASLTHALASAPPPSARAASLPATSWPTVSGVLASCSAASSPASLGVTAASSPTSAAASTLDSTLADVPQAVVATSTSHGASRAVQRRRTTPRLRLAASRMAITWMEAHIRSAKSTLPRCTGEAGPP